MSRSKRPLRWVIGDAVDEFAHRRLGFGMVTSKRGRTMRWYWRLTPFPFICNRRELSYGVPWETVFPNANTSASNTFTFNHITFWRRSHNQDPQ